ncbi:hypothetical protein BB560_004443 [Smittium megazygosporum]|uniref:U6 small nuclear RNA (adenine-(43)-N(6))-methyltransferase n=1 Tax=Smittium megazygosporum TaxID=133381 RepID=A0A2T9Z996_9FUNG|nr:hypothetical protein BB560_004443 [Smittium megazygosporum]
MSHFFNLRISIPKENLCPKVQNRLNYITWIAELIDDYIAGPEEILYGVDIGTGASCIYPLLGTAIYNNWRFIATEKDPLSLDSAQYNVFQNNLTNVIQLIKVDSSDSILDFSNPVFPELITFTMCNPPFYSSTEEAKDLEKMKSQKIHGLSRYTTNEGIVAGGECSFLTQMVEQSVGFSKRVIWFTSMVGKKSTLKFVTAKLNQVKAKRIITGTLKQGRTTRWTVAWTFKELFPKWIIMHRDTIFPFFCVNDKLETEISALGIQISKVDADFIGVNNKQRNKGQVYIENSSDLVKFKKKKYFSEEQEGSTYTFYAYKKLLDTLDPDTADFENIIGYRFELVNNLWSRNSRRKRKEKCIFENNQRGFENIEKNRDDASIIKDHTLNNKESSTTSDTNDILVCKIPDSETVLHKNTPGLNKKIKTCGDQNYHVAQNEYKIQKILLPKELGVINPIEQGYHTSVECLLFIVPFKLRNITDKKHKNVPKHTKKPKKVCADIAGSPTNPTSKIESNHMVRVFIISSINTHQKFDSVYRLVESFSGYIFAKIGTLNS